MSPGEAQTAPRETPAVGPDDFKAVMRHHAKGVTVITTNGPWPVGFCATSLASVSLRPPLLSFSVGLDTKSWRAIRDAAHVMVHLLDEKQCELAIDFARPGTDKFGAGTGWRYGAFGLPRLDDVLACVVLAVVSHFEVGDHALVVGQVVCVEHDDRGRRPLVHHNGMFGGTVTQGAALSR
jgi:flavin reductase (DIM6/NTAB) family NADH-FMN oxidoreductase RutF